MLADADSAPTPSRLYETPQSTPLKAAPVLTTTAATSTLAPLHASRAATLEPRPHPVPLKHSLLAPGALSSSDFVGPGSHRLGTELGFLTPQQPSSNRLGHGAHCRVPATCPKIQVSTWDETSTSTCGHNLSATPPRSGVRRAARPPGLEGSTSLEAIAAPTAALLRPQPL